MAKSNGATQISDLRANLKAMSAPPPIEKRPPKPRKQKPVESEDERWAKQEQQAMLQHTTSLLDKDKKSKKPYVRVGERPRRRRAALMFQLLLVLIIAGGVAYALDPTLIPQAWIDQATETVKSWLPAEA